MLPRNFLLVHFYSPCDNSIIGGSLIIAGLFGVTWASYKDRQATVEISSHDSWVSEPYSWKKCTPKRSYISGVLQRIHSRKIMWLKDKSYNIGGSVHKVSTKLSNCMQPYLYKQRNKFFFSGFECVISRSQDTNLVIVQRLDLINLVIVQRLAL
jgi:hypothetical protein